MPYMTDMSTDSPTRNALVSVIIPTYGRPDLLSQTINSVLDQTYLNIEIIVVDDNGKGSKNQIATEEVVHGFPSIRYITHETNQNGAAARNTGLYASVGEFVCFVDDDDCFFPKKIETQLEMISDYGFCLCGFEKVSSTTKRTVMNENDGNILNDALLYKKDYCSGSTLMVRRQVAIAVGGFDESLNRYQDYNFLIKVSSNASGIVIPEVLVRIHIHERSYKPQKYEEIEYNTLKYMESISLILNKLNPRIKIAALNENIYILIKKAILLKKTRKLIEYVMKYNGKLELMKRLCNDARRKVQEQ